MPRTSSTPKNLTVAASRTTPPSLTTSASGRSRKASVSWTVPTDVADYTTSPDLSKIVEEVVGRDGWKTGNTMSFIIETEGQWPAPFLSSISSPSITATPRARCLVGWRDDVARAAGEPRPVREDLDPRFAPTWGTCRQGFSPSVGFAWQPGLKGFFPADAGFGDADIYQAMDDVFGYPQSEMTLRHGGTCELQCPYGSEPVLADGKKDDGTVVDPAMAEVPLTTAPPRRHPPRTRRRPSHPLRTALTAPPLSSLRAGDVRPGCSRSRRTTGRSAPARCPLNGFWDVKGENVIASLPVNIETV